ncbi:hypothetical protein EN866_24170 [Mesorhizobium sp. M2D.F.Ca.ET.223.01.1.1]|uniref:hypothetical protein n=1 Tax=Mesorhizobium sp. M2D.F.Ca.ET.223.01.1.1 TaxID=2563940 RepID=UPI00109324DE|nr:hypothetical protein [Mesorhizobium sp. M2D.F.Ca.ET.223.01.1.1]TGP86397.1 hypothetical protein EN864_24180 [bacterium M00.F.Ca.ET.221.01.1.1]TGR88739.1 hypothetical protein EN866_24170 [Mesorhizobium sp. M2D.F.Ca.ET.223.01.1.1]
MTRSTPVSSGLVLALWCSQASAYTIPGHSECPWASPGHTWQEYFTGVYGPSKTHGHTDIFFSIRFTRDIGDIQGGECYLVFYKQNENWLASGKINGHNNTKDEDRHGGDPANFKINIWGAMFTYNEAGEVYYDGDGQMAGNMYCNFGSECWK